MGFDHSQARSLRSSRASHGTSAFCSNARARAAGGPSLQDARPASITSSAATVGLGAGTKRAAGRGDHSHVTVDEVSHQIRQPIVLDSQIASFVSLGLGV